MAATLRTQQHAPTSGVRRPARRLVGGSFCVVFSLLVGVATAAEFALVAKSVDDRNFVAAWRGCAEEALRFGDVCLLVGGSGATDPRFQALAIDEALKAGRFAGLAISVTASALVAKAVQLAKVPIITFDSPFDAKDEHLSLAYVGIDNLAFGRDLAAIANRLRPQGGSLCLMTSANDKNLALRVWGVRQSLSGNRQIPDGQRLNGEGGWTELKRCPWNSADQLERAERELAVTLKDLKPDVFIAVGHWPVVDTTRYRAAVAPYREDLVSKARLMIVATGKISAEQLALLDERLVHGYVSIDFEQIGRHCYRLMRAAVDGKPLAPWLADQTAIHLGK